MPLLLSLLRLYIPIGSAVLLGIGLSAVLRSPLLATAQHESLHQLVPQRLGLFLFWLGVPASIVIFLHGADLSGQVYLAPAIAWVGILTGLVCSRLWLVSRQDSWPRPRQGSFSLAAMLGNTGYIGYPVVLLLPQLGPDYFGWAIFYDTLGSLLGAYGLGVILAAEFGDRRQPSQQSRWLRNLLEVVRNPTILAFFLGLGLRSVPFPDPVDRVLGVVGWLVVMLALVLMGMRLQQLSSWHHLKPATVAVAIKMVLLPLLVGILLTGLGFDGPQRLVMVLQAGMPCAFANIVLAEAYSLDRDLTVACVGLSSALLLITLPVWLWGFAGG